MKKLLIVLICNLLTLSGFCQSLDSIKHIEIVSEIRDSMALINKDDIDVINRTFYELEISDSLNQINDSIINQLVIQNHKLDSIMQSQQVIILNDQIIQSKLTLDHKNEIDRYKKELKRTNNKKIAWQSTTGLSLLAIILIILL